MSGERNESNDWPEFPRPPRGSGRSLDDLCRKILSFSGATRSIVIIRPAHLAFRPSREHITEYWIWI